MWILLIPLIVVEIAFWMALLFFAWRAFVAFDKRNWGLLTIWTCLILTPFVFYYYKHFEADRKEVARANEIAALSRNAPPKTYPRLLEVYGHATEFELLIYLSVLDFKEVTVFQRPHKGEIYGRFVRLAPGCRNRGIEHYNVWKKRKRFSAPEKQDKDCLIGDWKTVSDDRSKIPAVVYRHGTQSTLQIPGNSWASGAYEIQLRTKDNIQLLDYWERPYITRPSWPGPTGYAFPSNTERKKYRQPKRLEFFLDAIGKT